VWLVLLGVCAIVSAVAAWTDTRTGHIPNWLTLPVVAIAPLAHLILGGLGPFAHSLVGLFACAALPLFLFRKGAMGGGDVKLFAALGAVLGWRHGLEVQVAAFVAGAVLALAKVALQGGLGRVLTRSFFLMANPLLPRAKRRELPVEEMESFRFGAAIFVGVLLVAGRQTWLFGEGAA
jgi:prepilin peptidase CpaA